LPPFPRPPIRYVFHVAADLHVRRDRRRVDEHLVLEERVLLREHREALVGHELYAKLGMYANSSVPLSSSNACSMPSFDPT
jgi:hypothetical protein